MTDVDSASAHSGRAKSLASSTPALHIARFHYHRPTILPDTLPLLFRYLRERCPVAVLVPLSLVLFIAGIRHLPVNPADALRGWLTMGLCLLLLRLSDDLADREIDRLTHPDRLTCSADPTALKALKRARIWMLLGAIALQLPDYHLLLPLLVASAFYGIFFGIKRRFSPLLQPVVLNSALGLFPIYGELLLHGHTSPFGLLLGLFFWLGALAHDYAHCVMDIREQDAARLNPINRTPPRLLAVISLCLFTASGIVGLVLYCLHYTGHLFLGVLAVCTLVIAYLEIRLLRAPKAPNARPFYWWGFLFFLLPALAHLLEVIWA